MRGRKFEYTYLFLRNRSVDGVGVLKVISLADSVGDVVGREFLADERRHELLHVGHHQIRAARVHLLVVVAENFIQNTIQDITSYARYFNFYCHDIFKQ